MNKGISEVGSLKISDTALSSLEGLTNYKSVGSLDVDNNKNISYIDLSTLETVKDSLVLSFNSDECEVKLDELIWASNLTIQDVADFSAGNLTKVNGTFNLAYNTFESIEFKSLKEVGGSLQIFANNDMTELSVNKLTSIGGEFRMYNNTDLEDMEESFAKLKTVEGAVDISGNRLFLSTLPKLKEVDGTFTFDTKSDEFDCTSFKKKLRRLLRVVRVLNVLLQRRRTSQQALRKDLPLRLLLLNLPIPDQVQTQALTPLLLLQANPPLMFWLTAPLF